MWPFRNKKNRGKSKPEEDSEVEEYAIELFHIASLVEGTSSQIEMEKQEREAFGKSFKDLLKNGRRPMLLVKDKNGVLWTAFGKVEYKNGILVCKEYDGHLEDSFIPVELPPSSWFSR